MNGSKIVKFSTAPLSYQEQDAMEYTIPVLNMAKQVLSEIKGHITIIRQVRSNRNMASHSKKVQKAAFYEVRANAFKPEIAAGVLFEQHPRGLHIFPTDNNILPELDPWRNASSEKCLVFSRRVFFPFTCNAKAEIYTGRWDSQILLVQHGPLTHVFPQGRG